ncbi:MAG TPA: response regulator [Candidatus Cybelea sp.]|nr:response regulator [Candidatus Cybelea sp.]
MGQPCPQRPARVRTLLVDDSEFMHEFLTKLLEREGGFELVGTAANGRQALLSAAALRPDLILMDVQMPVLDGLEATRIIRRVGAQVGYKPVIVIVTGEDTLECRSQATAAGANGFVPKTMHLRDELKAILEILFSENREPLLVNLIEEAHETSCAS